MKSINNSKNKLNIKVNWQKISYPYVTKVIFSLKKKKKKKGRRGDSKHLGYVYW